MGVRIKASGRYELRQDEHRHRFLVRGYPGHPTAKPVQRGRFYLVDFRDDPEFRDVPHLFLQKLIPRKELEQRLTH